jgi:hypothetical protein
MRPKKPPSTPDTREQRTELRVGVDTAIRLAITRNDTGNILYGWVRNLSLGGALVNCQTPFPPDTPVRMSGLARDGNTVYHLKMTGWVAYATEDSMGLQFDELDPEIRPQLDHLLKLFSD